MLDTIVYIGGNWTVGCVLERHRLQREGGVSGDGEQC